LTPARLFGRNPRDGHPLDRLVPGPLRRCPRPAHRPQLPLELTDILFLVVCATLAGSDDFVAIAEFGRERLDWLRRHAAFARGTPAHDTLDRVFRLLPPDAFQTWLLR
jgi:hypothetical protein